MKVKIICQKCGSNNVMITSVGENPTPKYKCNKCGYQKDIFPKLGNAERSD